MVGQQKRGLAYRNHRTNSNDQKSSLDRTHRPSSQPHRSRSRSHSQSPLLSAPRRSISPPQQSSRRFSSSRSPKLSRQLRERLNSRSPCAKRSGGRPQRQPYHKRSRSPKGRQPYPKRFNANKSPPVPSRHISKRQSSPIRRSRSSFRHRRVSLSTYRRSSQRRNNTRSPRGNEPNIRDRSRSPHRSNIPGKNDRRHSNQNNLSSENVRPQRSDNYSAPLGGRPYQPKLSYRNQRNHHWNYPPRGPPLMNRGQRPYPLQQRPTIIVNSNMNQPSIPIHRRRNSPFQCPTNQYPRGPQRPRTFQSNGLTPRKKTPSPEKWGHDKFLTDEPEEPKNPRPIINLYATTFDQLIEKSS